MRLDAGRKKPRPPRRAGLGADGTDAVGRGGRAEAAEAVEVTAGWIPQAAETVYSQCLKRKKSNDSICEA